MPMFLANLVLLQYIVCLIMAILGVTIFAKILYAVFINKSETRLNKHLVFHSVGWIVFMLTTLPLTAYTLSFWKGRETLYHSSWLFWTGVFNMCTSTVMCVMAFFVLMDRCLAVAYPIGYNYKWRRVNFVVMIVCTLAAWNGVFLVMLSEGPFPKMTHCLSFGCMLTNEGGRSQFLVRIIFGFINMGTLFLFLFLLVRSDQKHGQQYAGTEIVNTLARNIVIADLVTNFILSLVTFSVDQWTTIELSDYLGAFVMMISSLNGLLTAVVYAKTLSWSGGIRERIKAVVEQTRDELF